MLLLSGFFGYQVRSAEERIKSPCVSPLATHSFKPHFPLLNVGVVHIGDLQLPPRRRLLAPDEVEYVLIVKREASDDEIAFRLFRFLFDFHAAVASDRGNPQALVIANLL